MRHRFGIGYVYVFAPLHFFSLSLSLTLLVFDIHACLFLCCSCSLIAMHSKILILRCIHPRMHVVVLFVFAPANLICSLIWCMCVDECHAFCVVATSTQLPNPRKRKKSASTGVLTLISKQRGSQITVGSRIATRTFKTNHPPHCHRYIASQFATQNAPCHFTSPHYTRVDDTCVVVCLVYGTRRKL
jgi:hypothetical protein